MFDLDTAIATWRHLLTQRRAFLADDLDELEAHVRDFVAARVREGMAEEAAFRAALDRIGGVDVLEAEYRKVRLAKQKRKRSLFNQLVGELIMWKNYLLTAWRNVQRHPGYTLLNVGGLAVGLACCLLIGLYVWHEAGYDRFHEHADRTYRLYNTNASGDEGSVQSPHNLDRAIASAFPDVERLTSMSPVGREAVVAYGDHRFYTNRFITADSAFFDVFSFPLVRGDRRTALREAQSVVISEAAAQKWFADADPMGQEVLLNDHRAYTVTGVAHIPTRSHFSFDFVATTSPGAGGSEIVWFMRDRRVYLRLATGTDPEAFEQKLNAFVLERGGEQQAARMQLHVQRLTDIHLHSQLDGEWQPNSSEQYLYLLGSIAVLILLIACANYVNLSTARAAGRAREVGVRKAAGAGQAQLVRQFVGEAVATVSVALVVALLIARVALPLLNHLSGRVVTLVIPHPVWWVLGLIGLAMLIGTLAGAYPAFVLSRYRPVHVLKGGRHRRSGTMLRRMLVMVQFTAAFVLLVGTAVILTQLRFVQDARLGFDQDGTVVVPLHSPRQLTNYEAFKAELLRHPNVRSVSVGSAPGEVSYTSQHGAEADRWSLYHYQGGADYATALGLTLVAGRDFSSTVPDDALLLTESAVARLELEEPVGHRMALGEVVGVVEDFHALPLREPMAPVVIAMQREAWPSVLVKVARRDVQPTLRHLEATWQQTVSEAFPFRYSFLSEQWEALYRSERQLGQILSVFTLLAVLVACSGLFGLAAYVASQRTKEVGVRKALGASRWSIAVLLSGDFLRLVALALALAMPVAYLAAAQWLDNFAYRVGFGPGLFVSVAALCLALAVLAVGGQAWRAASLNPTKALRYE